jgi:hypothetical protein
MVNLKSAYWKTFNALARVVGAGFMVVGSIVAVFGIGSRDGLTVVVALVVVPLGVLLVRARPYRPDLGEAPFSERQKD